MASAQQVTRHEVSGASHNRRCTMMPCGGGAECRPLLQRWRSARAPPPLSVPASWCSPAPGSHWISSSATMRRAVSGPSNSWAHAATRRGWCSGATTSRTSSACMSEAIRFQEFRGPRLLPVSASRPCHRTPARHLPTLLRLRLLRQGANVASVSDRSPARRPGVVSRGHRLQPRHSQPSRSSR